MFCFEGNDNFDFFLFFATAALEVQIKLFGLQNSLVYKSQPPDIWDLFIYALTATKILTSNLELSWGWSVLIV